MKKNKAYTKAKMTAEIREGFSDHGIKALLVSLNQNVHVPRNTNVRYEQIQPDRLTGKGKVVVPL